jgi:hypothetical protein
VSRERRMAGGTKERVSPAFVVLSRGLLFLFASWLLISPWTEGYRLLDNFPRGQDSELSLLAILAFLGIVLLIGRSARRRVSSLLLLSFLRVACVAGTRQLGKVSHLKTDGGVESPPYGPAVSAFRTPLQI